MKETLTRKSFIDILTGILAFSMAVFPLYLEAFGSIYSLKVRAIHLSLALSILFLGTLLKRSSKQKVGKIVDFILAIVGIAIGIYILSVADVISEKIVNTNSLDLILGIVTILLTLEATRRVIGLTLPIISLLFIAYAYFGEFIPGILGHGGYSLERITSHMYLTLEGIYGIALGVSATFIIQFIVLGALLQYTGASKFMIDLALSLTGYSKGGPAKTAVVASALTGTVTGSTAANVATTGSMTIPLMKNTGYSPKVAGAIEAVASTGGMIMPPVMGAAALIMVGFTGIPYIDIIKAAIIPAILYYLTLFIVVHLEASKANMQGIKKEELPNFFRVLREGWYYLLPIIVLVILLIQGFTPGKAALGANIGFMVIYLIKSRNLKGLISALIKGGKDGVSIALACACAGIVAGIVTLTGLGFKVVNLVSAISGGELLIALIVTMFISLLLGMGLPASVSYILLATLAAPALVEIGVSILAAHLFIIYYGNLSAITPPVGIAAYTAGAIAETNLIGTAVTACRIGVAAFIIPFMFVYGESLLGIGTPFSIITTLLTAIVGVFSLAGSITGWFIIKCKLWVRIVLFTSALLLIKPGLATDISGVLILIMVIVLHWNSKRRMSSNILQSEKSL